jgi:hypothetical protein
LSISHVADWKSATQQVGNLRYTLTTWGESQLAKYLASINDALHVMHLQWF